MTGAVNRFFSKNVFGINIKIPSMVNFRGYAEKKHFKSKPVKVQMPACRKLKSTIDSVASRGFLRAYKEYNPPIDTVQKIDNVLKALSVTSGKNTDELFENSKLRCTLLSNCFDEFSGHGVPNSILHTVKCYNDLLQFYSTPVNITLPLDKLKTQKDLPPNLHIQTEPVRFIADEDVMFKGQTAFPKSNTLVTGLRSRKKYKGNIITTEFPDTPDK